MPPREKLPEVDRISHGTPHRLLVLSNGHGEDLIALRVCEALRRLRPKLPMAVLPLVGEGGAFAAAPQELALERLGPCLPLPSGGFSNQSVRGLLQDVAAGLPRTTWQQLQVVRRWGAAGQPILAIGDLLPLAMAWLSGGPYGFIGTPKSDYTWRSPSPAGWSPSPLADGYHRCKGSEWDPWEWALMAHRHCRLVAVRDALTARGLRSHHVRALAPGNPMMDGFEAKELPTSLRHDRRVLLLPGSRLPEALGNFKRLLSGLPHPSQCDSLGGVSVLVPISQGLNRSSELAAVMAEAHFKPVSPPLLSEAEGCWSKGSLRVLFGVGRFASWAPWAEVGLATAGTATEQLVGLGLPALSLPGAGPQFTVGFARRQSRLLGGAVEPCKTAGRMQMRLLELLEDASARWRLGRKGKQRMGPAGGSEALAHLIVARLLYDDSALPASRAG
ncbi:MAG: lipid-A-disaccharide synthase-related protein [Cyanobacteriota bacterium]